MKAKKIFMPIVIIFVIVAVLACVFSWLWFKTDVFNFLKPNSSVWQNQMEKALNVEGANFSDYSEFLNEYKEMSSKSYKSELNVTAKLDISELDSEVEDIINKSKIKIESNADISNKSTQNKIGLYSNSSSSEILTLDLVTNDTKFGVGCEDLYDKYLTVSIEDLIDYLKQNGDIDDDELEMLSNITGSNIDPYDLLYISDEDLKHFDDTYRNCLQTLISKDCYTSEKNVEVDVDGDDVKTTAYYLTLTGKDAYNFVKNLSDIVKDDDVLIKLITEKVNLVLSASGQDKIKESEVKDFMNDLIEEMLEELEEIKDEDESAVQIAVYSNKNNPVRIDVNIIEDVEDLDNSETVFSIEYADGKNIYTVYNNGKSYITVTDEYDKKSDNERTGKLTAKASGMSIGTLNYEIVDKDDESKLDLELNVPLADLSANVELTSKGNYKKEPVEISGLISFNYEDESAEIKFDGSIEYTDVSIPELTSKNSVDILKLSEKELETEMNTILKKASEILPKRLKSIGVNIDAEDIYEEDDVEDTNTENDVVETTEDDVA